MEKPEGGGDAMYFNKEKSAQLSTGVVSCTCGWEKQHTRPEKLARAMKLHAKQSGHTKVMGS